MKTNALLLLLFLILATDIAQSTDVLYTIDNQTVRLDTSQNKLSNIKNKIIFNGNCEYVDCIIKSDIFYPTIKKNFDRDSIESFSAKNGFILLKAIFDTSKRIVEISFIFKNIECSNYLVKALLKTEKELIGRKIDFTHNCPNQKYFEINWIIRFNKLKY